MNCVICNEPVIDHGIDALIGCALTLEINPDDYIIEKGKSPTGYDRIWDYNRLKRRLTN